jgi:hypothetical protein
VVSFSRFLSRDAFDKGGFDMIQLLLVAATIVLMMALVFYQVHKITWLRNHGRQVTAVVTSIRHETGKTSWGFTRDNYFITAKWTNPRTGRTYSFWTWSINSCPLFTKGSLIPVLIDPRHPQRYALNV